MIALADGQYPFIDERLPLSQMAMIEAPARLEALFKEQASRNGTQIVRDQPVELKCRSEEFPDATFLIWWPMGSDRIHMLVPKKFAEGWPEWRPPHGVFPDLDFRGPGLRHVFCWIVGSFLAIQGVRSRLSAQ